MKRCILGVELARLVPARMCKVKRRVGEPEKWFLAWGSQVALESVLCSSPPSMVYQSCYSFMSKRVPSVWNPFFFFSFVFCKNLLTL